MKEKMKMKTLIKENYEHLATYLDKQHYKGDDPVITWCINEVVKQLRERADDPTDEMNDDYFHRVDEQIYAYQCSRPR